MSIFHEMKQIVLNPLILIRISDKCTAFIHQNGSNQWEQQTDYKI